MSQSACFASTCLYIALALPLHYHANRLRKNRNNEEGRLQSSTVAFLFILVDTYRVSMRTIRADKNSVYPGNTQITFISPEHSALCTVNCNENKTFEAEEAQEK